MPTCMCEENRAGGRELRGEGVDSETEACDIEALSALAWSFARGRWAALHILAHRGVVRVLF